MSNIAKLIKDVWGSVVEDLILEEDTEEASSQGKKNESKDSPYDLAAAMETLCTENTTDDLT